LGLLQPDLLLAAAAPLAAPTATVLRELVEPTRPSHTDIDSDATQLANLDAEDFKRWALLKDDFNERMRDYKEKLRAISDLDSYIVSTLARNHHRLIRNLTTPYEKLKVLKQKLEPTSNHLQQSAQAAYDRAQKWNSRLKLEDWLKAYRDAYLDAEEAQLSVVNGYTPHYNFVRAIAQANPACSSVLHGILVQQQQSSQPPPDFTTSCLEFFENWQLTEPATQPGVTHTGFATFHGQPTQATTPSHERAAPPVSASSIQIDKFPYKFCLCTATR
jgi:hypothetical protein